jgi:hypothetical protein
MCEVLQNETLAPNVHRMVIRAPRIAKARMPGLGNTRSANDHAVHIGRQRLVLQNFKHVFSSDCLSTEP